MARVPGARAAGALLAGAALLLAAPSPRQAASRLAHPGQDPTAPVVAAAALAGWALVGYLLLVLCLAGASRLPGIVGATGRRLLRRCAPAALRRALAATLGLGIVLGAAPATAGTGAAGSPEAPPGVTASHDWPAPATGVPELDWPAAPSTPAAPDVPEAAGQVVVHPGDTLWDLAADALPSGADDRQVAQAWPEWWAANRTVIGEDPSLLLPGQQLQPPTS